MSSTAVEFYSNPDFELPVYKGNDGVVAQEQLSISNKDVYIGQELPDELKPALAECVAELYDSVEARTAKIDGQDYTFEIGRLQGTGTDIELRAATYQSSLTGNYGNGFEVASKSVAEPERSIVYIASIGMGLSSGLSSQESHYLRRQGSLLFNGKSLPVIQALGKVLSDMDIVVTHLGSDSAGAVMTMAYGAAYGKGAIRGAHQNVRTGMKDMNVLAMAKGMLIDDPKRSRVQAEISPDALRMRDDIVAFTTEHIGETYRSRKYKPKKAAAMLASYAIGLGRGPEHGDPLLRDNQAFARANPGATILFTIGEKDPLSESPDLRERVRRIVGDIARHSDSDVQAIVVEDTSHGIQTHYPQFLRAVARAALA